VKSLTNFYFMSPRIPAPVEKRLSDAKNPPSKVRLFLYGLPVLPLYVIVWQFMLLWNIKYFPL